MKFKLKKSQLREMILEEIRSVSEGELDAGPLAAKEQLLQAFGAGAKERVMDDDKVGHFKDMIVLRTDEDVAKAMELKDVIEGDFDWFIQLLSPSQKPPRAPKDISAGIGEICKMKITKRRLKQIILEEINLVETAIATDVESDVTEDDADMGKIAEGEGMELVQQVAQVLFDTGVTAAETPEELAMALKGLGKAALYALGGGALGAAGIAGRDAIEKIRSPDGSDEPSQALEEEEGDTLSALIMQAIQEQVEEMTSEND